MTTVHSVFVSSQLFDWWCRGCRLLGVQHPLADVASAVHVGKVDRLDRVVGHLDCAAVGRGDGGDAEDSATSGVDAVALPDRSGVEDVEVGILRAVQSDDLVVGAVLAGVAAAGQNDADAPAWTEHGLAAPERADCRLIGQLQCVGAEERQNGLHLWVAGAAVELDHFQPVSRLHQPGVEAAAERPAFLEKAV